MTSHNCFGEGHISRECPNPVKCQSCRVDGHREGDNLCHLNSHGTDDYRHVSLARTEAYRFSRSKNYVTRSYSRSNFDRAIIHATFKLEHRSKCTECSLFVRNTYFFMTLLVVLGGFLEHHGGGWWKMAAFPLPVTVSLPCR